MKIGVKMKLNTYINKKYKVYRFYSINETLNLIETNKINKITIGTRVPDYTENVPLVSKNEDGIISFSKHPDYTYLNYSVIPENTSIRLTFDIFLNNINPISHYNNRKILIDWFENKKTNYVLSCFEDTMLLSNRDMELSNINSMITDIEIYDIEEILERFEENNNSLISQNSLQQKVHETDDGYLTVKISDYIYNLIIKTNKMIINTKDNNVKAEIIRFFLLDCLLYKKTFLK